MTYLCTNDLYCTNSETFDSVEDFRAYCSASFGEEPNIEPRNFAAEWIDTDTGEVVLVALDQTTDTKGYEAAFALGGWTSECATSPKPSAARIPSWLLAGSDEGGWEPAGHDASPRPGYIYRLMRGCQTSGGPRRAAAQYYRRVKRRVEA